MSEREAAILAVRDRYEKRIEQLLARIGLAFEHYGYVVGEPFDLSDENYRWSLICRPFDDQDNENAIIDVNFEIPEALSYGDVEPTDGINFGLAAVTYGGRVLAELQPYNFTDEVWVSASDDRAVEERFGIIENTRVNEFVEYALEVAA